MATAAMACGVGVINQEVRLLAALVKNRVLRYSTLGERARLLTENKAGSNPATSAKFCGVEQRSARMAHNHEVVGSNPTYRNQNTLGLAWLLLKRVMTRR